jgi:DNA-binding transcriptional regulator YdaS (Cro superfamily)
MIEIVREAVEVMGGKHKGGVNNLAAALGIARQNLNNWEKVPAERVLPMEQATGISRHRIRPDLYPEPAPSVLGARTAGNDNPAEKVA